MNLKETLNEYFEQTEIPSKLHPDNIGNILEGKNANGARKEAAPAVKKEAAPAVKPSRTAPIYEVSTASEEAPATASALIKVVRYNKLTGTEFLSLLGNTKISNSTYQEIKNDPAMTVKRLIELLESSPLTEEDYKRLIVSVERTAELKAEAKTKAARQADAGLFVPKSSTPSPLDSVVDTYEKKTSSVGTATQIIREMDLEREARNIIERQEPVRERIPSSYGDDEKTEEGKVKQSYGYRIGSLKKGLDTANIEEISEEPRGSHKEAPKPPAYIHEDYVNAAQKESEEDYGDEELEDDEDYTEQPKRKLLFGMHGEDTEEDYQDETELKGKDRKKKKASKKSKAMPKEEEELPEAENDESDEYDEDYGKKSSKKKPLHIAAENDDDDEEEKDRDFDDDDDDDADYDDFGRRRKGSNKGKIIIAAIGAVLLIAVSFGLRYYLTGSFLPVVGREAAEEQLDEAGIFGKLFDLPNQTAPAFTANQNYTAGKARSGKMLTNLISQEKRLIYVSDNTLYVFEQIGGQLEKLSETEYPDTVEVLGLIGDNEGVGVVLKGENEDYSFSYNVTGENGADTVVNGSVQRTVTRIDLLDPAAPEKASQIKTVNLSGELSAIYKLDNRLVAVTWENIPEGAAKEDKGSFMPYASYKEKKLCSAENVLITNKAANKSFASIYTVDFDGNTEIAAVAGGLAQLICRRENSLFIGQGNVLARYDLSQGNAVHSGSAALDGNIADFSAIGVSEDEIRVTTIDNGAAVLTVLDSGEEMEKKSQVKNIGENDVYLTTCFNGKETYIVAEGNKCYGIDGEDNAIAETGSKITSAQVYPYSEKIGIKLTVLDDGQERTGLMISTVKLDGTMSEIESTEISSRTVAQNSVDKYISSPAEEDIFAIGGGAGTIVVPVVYFDGISEVELFAIYSVSDDGVLSYCGNVSEYDRNSKTILAAVNGTNIIAVTEGRIITAKAENGNVIGYFNY